MLARLHYTDDGRVDRMVPILRNLLLLVDFLQGRYRQIQSHEVGLELLVYGDKLTFLLQRLRLLIGVKRLRLAHFYVFITSHRIDLNHLAKG